MDKKTAAGLGILGISVGTLIAYSISKSQTATPPPSGGPPPTPVPSSNLVYSVGVIAPNNTQRVFILSETDFNKLGGLGVRLGNVAVVNRTDLNSYNDVLNWLYLNQATTSTSPPPTGGSTTPPPTGGIAGGQPPNTEPTGVQIQNLIISPISGITPLGCSFQLQGVTVASTILWDFGDGQKVSGGLVQSHTYFSAGTYNGSVHVTGPDGFSTDYRNFAIVVVAKPASTFINLDQINPTVQQNQSAAFSVSLGKAYTSITWKWGDGTPNTLNSLNPSHIFNTAGVFTGSVTVVATDGTTDTKSFVTTVTANVLTTITVSIRAGPASPTNIFASNVQFYLTEPIEFQAEIGGGISPFNITWDFGDGTIPTGEFVTKTFNSTGTKVVKCTVRDSKGTTQSATLSIFVSQLPLQSRDVLIVPNVNTGRYFDSDDGQPQAYISYVGGVKNTRTDRAVQVKVIIQIYRTDTGNVFSSPYKIVTVPAGATLGNVALFIGQILNDGKTAANIIYDAMEPLAGTQLHLDEKLGVFP